MLFIGQQSTLVLKQALHFKLHFLHLWNFIIQHILEKQTQKVAMVSTETIQGNSLFYLCIFLMLMKQTQKGK